MTFSFLDSPVVIELVSPVRTLWYLAVLHSSLSGRRGGLRFSKNSHEDCWSPHFMEGNVCCGSPDG